MTESIVIALIGFLGATAGSGLGIVASSKLTNYRLGQLEEQVRKHNSVIERTYEVEKKQAVIEEELKSLEETINKKI